MVLPGRLAPRPGPRRPRRDIEVASRGSLQPDCYKRSVFTEWIIK